MKQKILRIRKCWIYAGIFLLLVLGGRCAYHRHVWPWWHFKGQWYFILRDAEKAVAEKPNELESWTMLGCARYWRGDIEGSCKAYRRACELMPDDTDLRHNVTLMLCDLGQYDEAHSWTTNTAAMEQDNSGDIGDNTAWALETIAEFKQTNENKN